jgi:hypothetical protein
VIWWRRWVSPVSWSSDKAGLVNALCERRIPLFEGVFLLFWTAILLLLVQNEQQGEELDSSFEMILSTEDEFSTIEFITDEVLIVAHLNILNCNVYPQSIIVITLEVYFLEKGNNIMTWPIIPKHLFIRCSTSGICCIDS